MKAPKLHMIPLPKIEPYGRYMTVSRGQWDALIAAAYERGFILIEMDDNERPKRAYQKQGVQHDN